MEEPAAFTNGSAGTDFGMPTTADFGMPVLPGAPGGPLGLNGAGTSMHARLCCHGLVKVLLHLALCRV